MSVVQNIGGAGSAGSEFVACWSCKGPVASRALFCHTCGAVQAPGSTDHFTRLGLTPSFDIDDDKLEKQYLGFQRVLHPDRFAGKPAKERAIAESQAVALNEAYETLDDPLKRATYLLRLKGVVSEAAADKTVNDPALLMEAMEKREALSEAESAEAIEKLTVAAAGDAIEMLSEISKAFAADDLDAANRAVLRLRYLRKFLEEARLRRAALED
ncbi:Fe-S protein assembly co-chaperone HscB [Dongia rigui]|uniref:Co-chaperone protein HscB homolog n=1 Tax=Dongia rigui TaxID=940149 RepID=A0ABU5E148_9PROT|nr:Fe-S protein assembly co-chaperone HscB [Dongia rigui]MDY0873193.1 Fe-S protein assembly co-chaperone HscB [Dongia rigui]